MTNPPAKSRSEFEEWLDIKYGGLTQSALFQNIGLEAATFLVEALERKCPMGVVDEYSCGYAAAIAELRILVGKV